MQNKIKVLVADGIYPPAYTGGGLRAHRTYKRLSALYNVEFAVITTNRGGFQPGQDEYDSVKIYRIKSNKSLVTQIVQVYRLFKKHDLHTFDIVHGFGESLVVLATGLMAKYFAMKLIYEITVFTPKKQYTIVRKVKDVINYFRFGYARSLIYKNADLFIALNEAIKQHFIQQGISVGKIWKRPNPVDTTKYYLPEENEKNNIRKNLNIPKDAIVALIVGRFEPRKNQMFALEVIRLLPDNFLLLMVGPPDESNIGYLRQIQNKIRENGMQKKVRIFPEYHNDVERFYYASDILWIPSHSEGTPNAMFEAMCCGIPVIANEKLELGEYIKEEKKGYQVRLSSEKFQSASLSLEKHVKDKNNRHVISTLSQSEYSVDVVDGNFTQRLQRLYTHS